MKTRKAVKAITHEEVKRAIEKFKAEGGLIKRLPDERVAPRTLVGSKYSEYESVGGGFSEVGGGEGAGGEGGGEAAAA
jgi:hypothetical protein